MSYQTVNLRYGDQVVITTPAGPLCVSVDRLGNEAEHLYVTPPEGFPVTPHVPADGATAIFKRALEPPCGDPRPDPVTHPEAWTE